MNKRELKYLLNIIALIVIVSGYFVIRLFSGQETASPRQNNSALVYVTRAIDGDTVIISTREHVRLIGIDTPESRYNAKLERDVRRSRKDINIILSMGKEASDFTRGLVQGKKVRLEFDVQRHDKYGRLLAYLYLEDGTFVNAKIMEEGYAQVMTIPPNVKYADLFLKLQKEARKNNKGLWKGSAGNELF